MHGNLLIGCRVRKFVSNTKLSCTDNVKSLDLLIMFFLSIASRCSIIPCFYRLIRKVACKIFCLFIKTPPDNLDSVLMVNIMYSIA
jgi:hypothetical protein